MKLSFCTVHAILFFSFLYLLKTERTKSITINIQQYHRIQIVESAVQLSHFNFQWRTMRLLTDSCRHLIHYNTHKRDKRMPFMVRSAYAAHIEPKMKETERNCLLTRMNNHIVFILCFWLFDSSTFG